MADPCPHIHVIVDASLESGPVCVGSLPATLAELAAVFGEVRATALACCRCDGRGACTACRFATDAGRAAASLSQDGVRAALEGDGAAVYALTHPDGDTVTITALAMPLAREGCEVYRDPDGADG